MMILYSADDSPLMKVHSFERRGDALVIKAKVLGTMPITARLTPEEARKGMSMLSPKLIWFLLTLPFRRARRA